MTTGKGVGRANANKMIRQEALRQQLAAQGHLQHIIDLHSQLLDFKDDDMDAGKVQRIKIVMESKHKFVDKYLPTPKQIELTEGDGLGDMTDDELTERIKAIL
jgi:adenylosuccinate synthase